jgi:hypothetical protein
MNKIWSDIDYSYLDKKTITELELFFANTDLSREQRNKVVEFLGRSYDKGHLDGDSGN